MCKIKLKKILFEYLLNMLSNEKNCYKDDVDDTIIDLIIIKDNIIKNKKDSGEYIYFEIDDINETKLLQYVADKQIEIGFVNQDYLNEDGKKLQTIYDELYYQTN
ncbi:hypothetical protein ACFO6R_08495 [Eubacterium multiforme]|uniref:Uncharacterized protein n=1 Tax=Eubacterium multiforme TaxID=83339 RepID=A0ABT9UUR7_9FIRM|nr:hypothetical protein [Eubacterium multiforme]MDQ0150042.1 hypothetical protein [Eubacterium multiforme]